MMFLCLLYLAAAASALPTPEFSQNVVFTGPSGVSPDKNVVEFTITSQETEVKAKPENGFYIPKAPQLSPLYLFTFKMPKFPEDKKDENKIDNEEDKKPEEGKDAEEKYQLERINIFTDVFEPITSFGLSELVGILYSSDRA